MNLLAGGIALVGTMGAVIAAGMTVCHAFSMIRGIRGSAKWWVNLIPFIAPALPGALDSAGQAHRSKMVLWGVITAVLAIGVVIVQLIGPF